MSDSEFEIPTQPLVYLTEEEIEWARLARQRAATRDLRRPAESETSADKQAEGLEGQKPPRDLDAEQ